MSDPQQPGRDDPGDLSQRPSPYTVLNNPVGEPDPTEWPDPYDQREDPRAPDEEMQFAGTGTHTPVGATSTSEPGAKDDIEAINANAIERDNLDD